MTPEILVITGPTATGKTQLSIRLAKGLDGEIVSADSMQIYKGMDIGTAKPAQREMQGIPHHMIDIASPDEAYSVARYVREATECIDDIISRKKRPLLVGGTGLYIDSVISGRDFAENAGGDALREELNLKYDKLGGEEMLRLLSKVDSEAGSKLHPNDKKRVVRALEVYELTGHTISEHNRRTQLAKSKYNARTLALGFQERADLYSRIELRVDKMMERGLLGEVRRLLDGGLEADSTAMQAIGYKELAQALDGKMSIEDAVDKIKMESRRYAKRQMSWLGRSKEIKWILWEKYPNFDFGERISTEFFQ